MLLMERIKHLSRRSLIRLASFATALVITLVGAGFYGYNLAVRYRSQLEYTYARSLDDLSNYLDNINYTLKKEIYANTSAQIDSLAAHLWKDAGSAKSCLSQLPVTNSKIDGIYRFLSQVGDYALTLSKKSATGGKITSDDRTNLDSLSNYASELSSQVSDMQAEMSAGRLWIGEVRRVIESGGNPNEKAGSLSDNANKLNQAVVDYPALVYDGPFSDHMLQQKPKLLEGKSAITREAAKKIAASYMGVSISKIKDNGDENSTTPSYIFADGANTIAITKAGGYVVYMNKQRDIGDEKLSFNQASAKALEYLKSRNLGHFEQSYYTINEGICIVNFAFSQNGVICYSDLIKVGIALDNGEIMSVEARGYVMNHHDRTIPAFKNSAEQVRTVLSPLLEVQSSHKALIMSSGLNEILCYEFVCKGKNGEDVLVYVNQSTLQEEQIFILIKTDGGTLTR